MQRARAANNFDALRLVLACMVLWAHAYHLHNPPRPDPVFEWLHGVTYAGELAIQGFFIISGYLIAGSFARSRGLLDYFTKRVLRIFPGFLVAFAVSATVVPYLLVGRPGTSVGWLSLIRRAVTLDSPGLLPGRDVPVNGSMWTIAPEFCCYVFLAVIGLAGLLPRRRAMAGLAAASVALFAATRLIPAAAIHDLGRIDAIPKLLVAFTCGACAWAWWDRLTITPARLVIAAIVAAASLAHPVTAATVFIVAFTYLLLGFGSLHTPVICRAARFGDFSYGIYLYAFPVQIYLVQTGRGGSPLYDAALVALLTLPLAVASWHLVERPALAWKVRHSRSAVAVADVPAPAT